MRLRVFEGRTMGEALEQMRRSLGPDAVLVASRTDGDRVRVTAAVERDDDLGRLLGSPAARDVRGELREVLRAHGLPEALHGSLIGEQVASGELGDVLTEILLARRAVDPLASRPPGPLVVVGPPGAGKTAVTAKLAAAAVLGGRKVRVSCLAPVRAGETARLSELLAPVGIVPSTVTRLSDTAANDAEDALVLVDTPAINPYRGRELAALAESIGGSRCETLLVWPCGADPEDSHDMAANLVALGIRHAVATRLDMTRRLGGVLAAVAAGVVLRGCCTGPSLAHPVVPLTASKFAALLLARAQPQKGSIA